MSEGRLPIKTGSANIQPALPDRRHLSTMGMVQIHAGNINSWLHFIKEEYEKSAFWSESHRTQALTTGASLWSHCPSPLGWLALLTCVYQSFSEVWFFASPWPVAHQAPLSMEFSQTRILEWVAISYSRGSSQPRDGTWVSCIAADSMVWVTREALLPSLFYCWNCLLSMSVPLSHHTVASCMSPGWCSETDTTQFCVWTTGMWWRQSWVQWWTQSRHPKLTAQRPREPSLHQHSSSDPVNHLQVNTI